MAERLGHAIACAAIAFFSCGPSSHRVGAPTYHDQGVGVSAVVRSSHGASEGAVVFIFPYEGQHGEERRTDRQGRFAAALQPGRYRMTIASVDGFWVGDITSPGPSLDIALHEHCEVLRGRVSEPVPTGTLFAFAKSTSPFYYLGAAVEANGSYEVCLPRDRWSVIPDEGYATLESAVTLPHQAPFPVDLFAEKDVRSLPTADPVRILDPIKFLSTIPQRVRVVGIGEGNHGTKEFLDERVLLSAALADQGRARFVVMEAGPAEVAALNDYVQGQRVDLYPALSSLGYWTWDTEDLAASLRRLREHNQRSPTHRIELYGMDIQKVVRAPALLNERASEYGWTSEQQVAVLALKGENDESLRALSAEHMSTLRTALEQALAYEKKQGNLPHALSARGLLLHIDYALVLDQSAHQAFRDHAMADMVSLALEMKPDDGIMIWAHNAHLAMDKDGGIERVGAILRKAITDRYFAIGSFVYGGAARAWDPLEEVGVIPQTLPPSPPYSMESVVLGREQTAFVNLQAESAAFRQWFALPRYVREFGAGFPLPEQAWSLRRVDQAYDAIAVYRTATPTTPTPTGVRKAEPRAAPK